MYLLNKGIGLCNRYSFKFISYNISETNYDVIISLLRSLLIVNSNL